MEFRKELKYLSKSSSLNVSPEYLNLLAIQSTSKISSRVITSPSLPFLDTESRFSIMFNIYIAGMMPNNCKKNFVLNLFNSKFSKKIIPFHMSVRPEHQVIVRNSMSNYQWSPDEELYLEGPFPFVYGTHFDLMLCHKPNTVTVAVNGQLAFEWNNRMDFLIDTLEMTGNLLITSVRYEFK